MALRKNIAVGPIALLLVFSRLTDPVGLNEPSFMAETSFKNAPLNSRVGQQILKGKGRAKQDTFENIPVNIQEAIILEDLLHVLAVRTRICLSTSITPPGYLGD